MILNHLQGHLRTISSSRAAPLFLSRQLSISASSASKDADLYALLGVSPDSSVEEIKRAFYQRAKEFHPDVHVKKQSEELKEKVECTTNFVRLAAAYEVLSDPRTRLLYDNERRTRGPAAGSSQWGPSEETPRGAAPPWDPARPAGGAAEPEVAEWLRRYRTMVTRAVHGLHLEDPSAGGGRWSVGEAQRRARADFHSALRTAYFGPPLEEGVLRGEGLPECFEGEERAQAGVGEVLHLVHGRRLLGVVREREGCYLAASHSLPPLGLQEGARATGSHSEDGGGPGKRAGEAGDPTDTSPQNGGESRPRVRTDRRRRSPSGEAVGPSGWGGGAGAFGGGRAEGGEEPSSEGAPSGEERMGGGGGTPEAEAEAARGMQGGRGQRQPARGGAYAPLQLELHGRVVALAWRRGAEAGEGEATDCISVYGVGAAGGEEDCGGWWRKGGEAAADARGVLLGRVYGLGGSREGSCRVEGEGGGTTHTVVHHRTPGVRHMLWYRQERGRQRCECRLRRAWLPPSRYWLFEPRCSTHDSGGWYFEMFSERAHSQQGGAMNPYARMGHRSRARPPGWLHSAAVDVWNPPGSPRLHPAVYILAAAYKTLDEEVTNSEKMGTRIWDKLVRWERDGLWPSDVKKWWLQTFAN